MLPQLASAEGVRTCFSDRTAPVRSLLQKNAPKCSKFINQKKCFGCLVCFTSDVTCTFSVESLLKLLEVTMRRRAPRPRTLRNSKLLVWSLTLPRSRTEALVIMMKPLCKLVKTISARSPGWNQLNFAEFAPT